MLINGCASKYVRKRAVRRFEGIHLHIHLAPFLAPRSCCGSVRLRLNPKLTQGKSRSERIGRPLSRQNRLQTFQPGPPASSHLHPAIAPPPTGSANRSATPQQTRSRGSFVLGNDLLPFSPVQSHLLCAIKRARATVGPGRHCC